WLTHIGDRRCKTRHINVWLPNQMPSPVAHVCYFQKNTVRQLTLDAYAVLVSTRNHKIRINRAHAEDCRRRAGAAGRIRQISGCVCYRFQEGYDPRLAENNITFQLVKE